MNGLTDQQLLQDYAEHRSEAAFAELACRHVGLVYSAAVRMVRDGHLAEDVTQGVFVALAENAPRLGNRRVLAGWLHHTTQYLAANVVRAEVRRRVREQEAAAMNELLATEPDASWELIAPHLDAALGDLSELDRDAVLLRYFENKSLREVGQALGTSDDTAQKRVGRAVERLREFFARRGVTVGASGLVVVVSANAVQAVPVGLAVTISTAAALGGTTVATTATAAAIKAVAMTNIQKILIVAALATPAVTGIYESFRISHLRNKVQALQEEQAPLADRINQIGQQQEDAMKRLTAAREESGRLQRNLAELHRLRGQIAQWQGDSAELARLKAATPSPEAKLRSWVGRAAQLKQRFEQMPDQAIPEFQLVTQQDFQQDLLDAVKDRELDTEIDYRQAMSRVRTAAEYKFANLAQKALKQYAQTNNGQFPPDLSRLKPYFESPVDDAALERFKIVPADQAGKLAEGNDGWVILQKAPVDEEYDKRWMIGLMGVRVTGEDGRWTSKAE